MSQVLKTLLEGLTPPPFYNSAEYDGWEYKWRVFTFRPAYFKIEAGLLAGLLLVVVFFLWGKSQNSRRANKWMDAHLPLLASQFSKPTVDGLKSDGYSDFFNFSTGRRAVTSLHTIFTLRPRHDLLQMLYQIGWGLVEVQTTYPDDLQLDFKLNDGTLESGFVWAVVKKDELRTIRDARWDLTFTKTTENPALPAQFSIMAEQADITETILKTTTLVQLLKDPAILPYFRSLTITDQPRERPVLPSESVPLPPTEKHLILSLNCPPPSSADVTVPFITSLFPFIDSLPKLSLRPDTKNKLKKIREDVDKALREEAGREKKEELEQQLEEKKAEKKRQEQDRISKLSAAEQQKILDRERKRSMRKQQGKVSVRK
ncbi:hypothetical protein EYR40_005670 [Pleurotus pulmonarius]|nr:hypothetical protein EYR36_005933 [Pleurotus pulmonarius]KAF4600640.1 hypothetical protein EYR38_005283 [Pleurotus pulmonarius]KAF4602463.1 hypothetical protein EYR40_005670 [Pleurotus pulmonarius]